MGRLQKDSRAVKAAEPVDLGGPTSVRGLEMAGDAGMWFRQLVWPRRGPLE